MNIKTKHGGSEQYTAYHEFLCLEVDSQGSNILIGNHQPPLQPLMQMSLDLGVHISDHGFGKWKLGLA